MIGELYIVYLDGNFVGIAEDKYECADIAENANNGVGKPLPDVLKRKGMQWYELQDNEIAEIFTMMNPDKRLFFSKFEKCFFIRDSILRL